MTVHHPPSTVNRQPSTGTPPWGLVLGGGGARSFAHLGVLLELEEAGLAPSFLCGGSMGAALAALYAAQPGDEPRPAAAAARAALDHFGSRRDLGAQRRPPKSDRLRRRPGFFGRLRKGLAVSGLALATAFRPGLRRRHPLYRVMDRWFGDRAIESLRLPFACVVLDLTGARVRTFRSGPLAPALKAGMAVGFVFAPFRHEGRWLADAAPLSPVPVDACRGLGAIRTLAVDLTAPVGEMASFETGMDVALRIIASCSRQLAEDEMARADLVVRPEAQDVFWGDFTQGPLLVERGRQAMRQAMGRWRAILAV